MTDAPAEAITAATPNGPGESIAAEGLDVDSIATARWPEPRDRHARRIARSASHARNTLSIFHIAWPDDAAVCGRAPIGPAIRGHSWNRDRLPLLQLRTRHHEDDEEPADPAT